MRALAVLLLVLPACTGEKPDDSGEDTGPLVDTDDPAVEPVVVSVDAYCALPPGASSETWYVSAQVSDPQGAETVVSGEVRVARDGSDLTTQALTCDGTSTCTGSFDAAATGIVCAEAGEYIFSFTVTDADGHVADAFGCQGRQGS